MLPNGLRGPEMEAGGKAPRAASICKLRSMGLLLTQMFFDCDQYRTHPALVRASLAELMDWHVMRPC